MKFALIDGERSEPVPGATGQCPGCGQEVLAKCGSLRVWHWSHKGRRTCDPWWEPETEWHRAWKNLFPEEWQEVPMRAEDGELHIADVRTPDGLVLEFQHSAIKPEERLSRERFYKRMLWIVDGTRLKNDRPRIDRAIRDWRNMPEMRVGIQGEAADAFPRRWVDATVPVLFDFHGLERDEEWPSERENRPPSVLRDAAWWNSRGARPDPLVYLVPYPDSSAGLYLVFRRETFLDAVVSKPDLLDHAPILERFFEVQKKQREAAHFAKQRRHRSRF